MLESDYAIRHYLVIAGIFVLVIFSLVITNWFYVEYSSYILCRYINCSVRQVVIIRINFLSPAHLQ